MALREQYVDGEPCWADVMARDPAAARAFYSSVLGWTYQTQAEEYGGYSLCLVDGQPVAGMQGWQPQMGDVPATWSTYLRTAAIDEVVASVAGLGGSVAFPVMDIPNNGRMAFGADPAGARFGLWCPAEHRGFGRTGEPGAFAWAELVTDKPVETDRFYAGLFGYDQRQIGDNGFDYTVWHLGDEQVCGRYAAQADPQLPRQWMLYFAVADTEASVERVLASGGSVRTPPMDSPYGRIAGVADPEGAAFCLVDLSRAG